MGVSSRLEPKHEGETYKVKPTRNCGRSHLPSPRDLSSGVSGVAPPPDGRLVLERLAGNEPSVRGLDLGSQEPLRRRYPCCSARQLPGKPARAGKIAIQLVADRRLGRLVRVVRREKLEPRAQGGTTGGELSQPW